ncbi:Holliday junction DNA helicase RuvB C-terminal domain-containing protein [Yinghuangia aomiensis]
MLHALVTLFGGGPVGLSTLAVAVGEETETVEEVAEPFLVRSGCSPAPRGRVATAAAWKHLGLVPPQNAASGQSGRTGQPGLFGIGPEDGGNPAPRRTSDVRERIRGAIVVPCVSVRLDSAEGHTSALIARHDPSRRAAPERNRFPP